MSSTIDGGSPSGQPHSSGSRKPKPPNKAPSKVPTKPKLKPHSLFFSDKNIFTCLSGPLGRLPTETMCYILKLAMTVPDETFFATGNASDGPFAAPKVYEATDTEEADALNSEEALSSAVSDPGDEARNALQLNLQEPVPPQTPVHEEPARPEPLEQQHHHLEPFGPLRDFTRNPFLSGYPAQQVATTFPPFVSHFVSVDPSRHSIGILDHPQPQFVFGAGDPYGFGSVAFPRLDTGFLGLVPQQPAMPFDTNFNLPHPHYDIEPYNNLQFAQQATFLDRPGQLDASAPGPAGPALMHPPASNYSHYGYLASVPGHLAKRSVACPDNGLRSKSLCTRVNLVANPRTQVVTHNSGRSTPTTFELNSTREPTLPLSPTDIASPSSAAIPMLGPMASRVAILQVCWRFYRLSFLHFWDTVVISHKNQVSPFLKQIRDQATLRDHLRRLRIEIRDRAALKKIINCNQLMSVLPKVEDLVIPWGFSYRGDAVLLALLGMMQPMRFALTQTSINERSGPRTTTALQKLLPIIETWTKLVRLSVHD